MSQMIWQEIKRRYLQLGFTNVAENMSEITRAWNHAPEGLLTILENYQKVQPPRTAQSPIKPKYSSKNIQRKKVQHVNA